MTTSLERETVLKARSAFVTAGRAFNTAEEELREASYIRELDVYRALIVLVEIAESLPSLLSSLAGAQATSSEGTSAVLSAFPSAETAADELRTRLGTLLSLVIQTRYPTQDGK